MNINERSKVSLKNSCFVINKIAGNGPVVLSSSECEVLDNVKNNERRNKILTTENQCSSIYLAPTFTCTRFRVAVCLLE